MGDEGREEVDGIGVSSRGIFDDLANGFEDMQINVDLEGSRDVLCREFADWAQNL